MFLDLRSYVLLREIYTLITTGVSKNEREYISFKFFSLFFFFWERSPEGMGFSDLVPDVSGVNSPVRARVGEGKDRGHCCKYKILN